jgi:signal transduction histidine kinase
VFEKYQELHAACLAGSFSPALLLETQQVREAADLDYVNEEIPKALQQSLEGVDRVASIVRAMKAFAHPGQEHKAMADLNKALENALIVARNELKYVADVETDFGDLPPLYCNIGDLNQVFLNLLINAAHAIAEVVKDSGNKGCIKVETRSAAEHVQIVISDTGCGVPSSIQNRIFDPFFTTKDVGKGTGQGLAIARTIVVERHGGRITFEPNAGQGTRFIVQLPIPRETTANEAEALTEAEI